MTESEIPLMSQAKRGPGRPRRSQREGPGDYVGFRASRDLKERLAWAAARTGRSLSTEAQFRLEESFRSEDLLPRLLDLAYGREAAGLLLLIGECMRDAGPHAAFFAGEGVAGNWTAHPWSFRQIKEAITYLFEGLQPPGTSEAVTPSLVTGSPPPINEAMKNLGVGFASGELGALFGPAESEGDLNKRLLPARERLLDLVEKRERKNDHW
jgi:hypothetical protein